jgi:hypothetical protein
MQITKRLQQKSLRKQTPKNDQMCRTSSVLQSFHAREWRPLPYPTKHPVGCPCPKWNGGENYHDGMGLGGVHMVKQRLTCCSCRGHIAADRNSIGDCHSLGALGGAAGLRNRGGGSLSHSVGCSSTWLWHVTDVIMACRTGSGSPLKAHEHWACCLFTSSFPSMALQATSKAPHTIRVPETAHNGRSLEKHRMHVCPLWQHSPTAVAEAEAVPQPLACGGAGRQSREPGEKGARIPRRQGREPCEKGARIPRVGLQKPTSTL